MLGTLEMHVMLAVLRKGRKAYGVSIAEELEKRTKKRYSLGAIYTTLERMLEKKFVSARKGEATDERGGRAKKYFEVTALGQAAIYETLNATSRLSKGLRLRGATVS